MPDQVFLDLADGREKTAFGIKGRPNMGDPVPLRGFGYDKREPGGNKVGRFGRKAQAPTVAAFNAGALLNEVGLASKDQPLQNTRNGPAIDYEPEISQEDVDRLNAFSRFLAPPFPDGGNPRGEKIFKGIGCALCHVPTLKTGKNTIGIPEGIEFHPYSDFLLHKMGPTLADRIVEAGAAGDEWRTAPLWGLRLRTRYLHDGRARTLDEAITMHASRGRDGIADSEANYVIGRYVLLNKQDKAALLDWLSHQ